MILPPSENSHNDIVLFRSCNNMLPGVDVSFNDTYLTDNTEGLFKQWTSIVDADLITCKRQTKAPWCRKLHLRLLSNKDGILNSAMNSSSRMQKNNSFDNYPIDVCYMF